MPSKILISAGEHSIRAELNDSTTAQMIIDQLPLVARGNWWGDEIYFSIPVECAAEADARTTFAVGELGYWPPGNAFCIFFGPTPVSTDGTPQMANPGTPVGQTLDDPELYRSIPPGSEIRLELEASN